MSDLPFVSVVVCTRNRAHILAQSSAALLAIDYPPDRWEVLIVDNRSTDDTLKVAHEIARRSPDRVRVIEERELGLSASRNAGIREARGDIIAFIDDDAFPESGWLRTLVEVLQQGDALVAGGPVEPWFQAELPAWFGDRYQPYLAAWDRGTEVHSLTYNDYPRGNNIAFRRVVFERYGYFSRHLGRTGSSLLSCEETELCLRVERGGDRILYAPGARIRHLTVTDRLTPEWLARRFFAQGRSEAIVEWRHAGWRGLGRGWLHWSRMGAEAMRQRRDLPDGWIYLRCLRYALTGYFWGILTAPLTVPRYRPAHGDSEWVPWQKPASA
ncbi:MAG TPA: glycosyltransferase [Thermoanaerobaculia bacterium]|jgi:glycosyltransferase involved in cell wall biosynthesis|nr:glycosyltransferase [Thermoanaerobaculia bacterium]